MLKAKIPSGSDTFHANTSDTTYHMGENAAIDAPVIGIDVSGIATGRRIEIDGTIHALRAVSVGVGIQPAPRVELFIGKNAELDGSNEGVTSYCSDLVMRNAGKISGPVGVEVHGGINLVNTGEISGFHAINFYGEFGSHVVRNAGTITGSVNGTDGLAIYGGGQIEKVTNTGTIHGDVDLGGANDVFIFKSGVIDGEVRGGVGDDLFITNKAGLDIVESVDAGEDSVRSSVTFELQANVENLKLIGRKDIDAIGTGGENELIGNSGKNLLFGWYGNDVLDGGKGNDKLTSGFGADEFHFQRGGGTDRVTDFEVGMDHIYLGDLKGATDFDNMMAHHVQAKGDDIWITYGDDVVVLKGKTEAQLNTADFDFS
ncbi:calcium-binding protein [Rhizobium sp. LjRoot254]|uniref:calcium-binding protein n=1 Tax=Rhizobium sp. LjRoot254 TaxID=3342297 RepID=UPI003ECE0EC1